MIQAENHELEGIENKNTDSINNDRVVPDFLYFIPGNKLQIAVEKSIKYEKHECKENNNNDFFGNGAFSYPETFMKSRKHYGMGIITCGVFERKVPAEIQNKIFHSFIRNFITQMNRY